MATEIAVSIISVPLVEDAPNAAADSALRATLQDRDITDLILETNLYGFSTASERYFNYGRDTFTNGLPEGTLSYGVTSQENVQKVLSTIAGEEVAIAYLALTPPEVDFIAYEYLQVNQDLDERTGLIGSPDFATSVPVYFESSSINGVGQIDITFREDQTSPIADTYVTQTYNVANLNIKEVYYQAIYYLVSDVNQDFIYWSYNTTTGTYPTLELNVFETPESTYFPIVPIRTNKVNLVDAPGDLKDTSTKMLSFMTIDLESITEDIVENPDIADIDDIYLMYAVDIQSEVPETMEYLHRYFLDLSLSTRATKESFLSWQSTVNTTNATSLTVNSLDISDGEAKFEISYNYIDVTLVTGSIGDVGTVTRVNIFRPTIVLFDEGLQTSRTIPAIMSDRFINNSSMVLRKQISVTEYIEIDINGLTNTSWVYQDYIVKRTLESSVLEDSELFIPLNHLTLNEFTSLTKTKTAVLYDSMKLVFHAVQITKLEWYQTGIFKALVTVVVVIVAAVTFQPQLVFLVGAFTASTTLGLLMLAAILINVIVVGIALDYAVKEVLKYVDAEIAAAIAVVVAVASFVSGKGGFPTLPWADTLLSTSLAVTKSIGNYLDEELQDLFRETQDFLKDIEERQEEIDEANDLLDNSLVDPLLIINNQPILIANETPFDFFQRTIHNTNPGLNSLGVIENYVSRALKLPDTEDLTNNFV